ncbi:MAG TPA: cob(I)yrinic acid a,c-diamide adenosyltransferase [Vitreimonas sp.]|nr:cob(I)yrinic acid a,c-diamide adenosyltransferase [Vitreimonas sp.]
MLSVSTKTGDKGVSGLANGQRVGKDELIFEVLGTVDELSSWIGLSLVALSAEFAEHKQFLKQLQETLFYIGAELALSPKAKLKKEQLLALETISESLQQHMAEGWTTKFLFPGGSEAAARLDVTRTVARKLERLIVRYSKDVTVSALVFQYVNRLSDYLYVLRCFVNQQEAVVESKFEVR